MTTLLTIENEKGSLKYMDIFADFEEINGFPLTDKILVNESECGKYEYVYVFLPQDTLDSLINIILNHNTVIYSKKDFTIEMIDILMENKLDDFKSTFEPYYEFDSIVSDFYNENIDVDMVLDKANKVGFDSLTENDYTVLK
jgi:hypothetical protein